MAFVSRAENSAAPTCPAREAVRRLCLRREACPRRRAPDERRRLLRELVASSLGQPELLGRVGDRAADVPIARGVIDAARQNTASVGSTASLDRALARRRRILSSCLSNVCATY